jgi:hypothetical protein
LDSLGENDSGEVIFGRSLRPSSDNHTRLTSSHGIAIIHVEIQTERFKTVKNVIGGQK